MSLNRVGDFALQIEGNHQAARQHYQELLDIARRIVSEFGETPQRLRDVWVSVDRVGDFDLQIEGNHEAAR